MNILTDIQSIIINNKLLSNKWGLAIISAEIEGGFTRTEKQLVGNWTFGPCGNSKYNIVKIKNTDIPQDQELVKLERLFARSVNKDEVLATANLLVEIEKRIFNLAKF
tara:strand:+ start:754 stop:1077 length:324 start_codon:yes stop_codon:yes gene_type:complete